MLAARPPQKPSRLFTEVYGLNQQIVMANRDEGKISYYSGSIENPTICDRALKVLEGGEAAFKKRQEKYRIGV